MGDLVLIILDERHDNYVLFTVGPTLYFLHSESLTALDLKPGEPPHLQEAPPPQQVFTGGLFVVPASGTSRRPWVLGKVIEKEYCQAKKVAER